MNRIIKYFVLRLENWCEHHKRTYLVSGRAKDGSTLRETYLVRHIILKTNWFSIYIHRFLLPDDESHHDHPWPFLTYIVDGQYKEDRLYELNDYYPKSNSLFFNENKIRKAGSLAFRKPTDIHRVIIDKTYTFKKRKQAPLSLCIMGPRLRNWGFWVKIAHNRRKWIAWDEFLEVGNSKSVLKRSKKNLKAINA